MQYKVLALDLDGTLTNTEKVITPRTKAALQEAARRGVCIVLASGRPTVGIEPLARELELEKYGGCILSYNGGKIIDCRTGQTLVQHAFPADLIEPVCTFSRYWNVVPLTYDKNGIVTEVPDAPYVLEEARINKIPVRKVENLPAEVTYPINKLPLAEGLATYPTEEELLTEALLGAENTGRDVKLFMNRMEHDDYRSVPELYQARCPECGAPLQNDEVWLKRGNTGYFTRAACPYCGHWYLRFKLSRRDGLHWSFARCIDPATPEYDARWDKQKAALLERMKRKQERNIKE